MQNTTTSKLPGVKITKIEILFNDFRTITLGTYKDVPTLKSAITDAGFQISDYASDIMDQPAFTIAPQEEKIRLVEVSVADMGFPNGTNYRSIKDRVVGTEVQLEDGLYEVQLCPAEVGPQLRLHYKDQPKGEWLRIAMEAITGSDGDLTLFGVERDGGVLWLFGDNGRDDRECGGGLRFVFCLRKKAL